MARKRHVLFVLDENERFLLCCDDRQWIFESGNPEKRQPGKDTGYRALTYVPATKAMLM